MTVRRRREVNLSLPSCFIQFVRTDGDALERPKWQEKINAANVSLLN